MAPTLSVRSVAAMNRRRSLVFGSVLCACVFTVLQIDSLTAKLRNEGSKPKSEVKMPGAKLYYGLDLRPNVKVQENDCQIPDLVRFGQPWPQCADKIKWMSESWKTQACYAEEGVNGSLCSILEYLSMKERSCPPERDPPPKAKPILKEKVTAPQGNLSQVIDTFSKVDDFIWIKDRISAIENLWVKSGVSIFERSFKKAPLGKKRIHLHLGLMELGMGKNAGGGGPLGELVQWSDLIASLHILGHEIVITHTKRELLYTYTEYIYSAIRTGCLIPPGADTFQFDLVYTDIRGYKTMAKMLPKFDVIKCRFRVLDSFGTEAEFNVAPESDNNPFGGLNLALGQFNTMYPHSPDNTFLGFVVEKANSGKGKRKEEKRDIALVYGKEGLFWRESTSYIKIVNEYVQEVHATVTGDMTEVPDFVINHGMLPPTELQDLLQRTKIFIGLGFPFEGPAPLEAIANGAVFLNPRFKEPVSAENHEFYRNKPTRRTIQSQNPYAELHIGEPYAYTVNVTDERDLRELNSYIEQSVQEGNPCTGIVSEALIYFLNN